MTDRARRGPAAPRVRLPYARSRAYNDVRLPRGPRCPVGGGRAARGGRGPPGRARDRARGGVAVARRRSPGTARTDDDREILIYCVRSPVSWLCSSVVRTARTCRRCL